MATNKNLSESIDDFLIYQKSIRNLSDNTIESYKKNLIYLNDYVAQKYLVQNDKVLLEVEPQMTILKKNEASEFKFKIKALCTLNLETEINISVLLMTREGKTQEEPMPILPAHRHPDRS